MVAVPAERVSQLAAEVQIHTHICVIPERFEPDSFPLKYNPLIFEYKIHSVEVDLHYFK